MVPLLISINRRGFPGCAGRGKGQEGSSFPSALCRAAGASPHHLMLERTCGSSPHAVLALSFLSKESFHDLIFV